MVTSAYHSFLCPRHTPRSSIYDSRCVEVTLLDGLVASRDARSHSVNYHSAMVFGTCVAVEELDAKRAIFECMT